MDWLIQYAFSWIGKPYVWGAKNMIDGCDCSGLVSEILKSCGVLAHHDDLNAQEIYNKLESTSSLGVCQPGSLAFYGESVTKITHVVFCIDRFRAIGADGGDHTCTTPEAAAEKGAFVKIRPIQSAKYRLDLVATLKPNYASIGLV